MKDFAEAVGVILDLEGGATVTKDPRDPGGTTKYGIAQRYHPGLDVENISEDTARGIYREQYWKPSGAELLPWPLSLCVFDCAVNQGVEFAKSCLKVSTVPAVYLQMRYDRYRTRPHWPRFGRGWTNRLKRIAEVGGFDWSPPEETP